MGNRIINSREAQRIHITRGGIHPYPSRDGYSLYDGERSELVSITQLMLNALSLNYDIPGIPVSGLYDMLTADAVREFQRVNLIPESGRVDPITWDRLAEEYNLTVNDNQ